MPSADSMIVRCSDCSKRPRTLTNGALSLYHAHAIPPHFDMDHPCCNNYYDAAYMSFILIEWGLYVLTSNLRDAELQASAKRKERAYSFKKTGRANRQQHSAVRMDLSNSCRRTRQHPLRGGSVARSPDVRIGSRSSYCDAESK